MGHREIICAGLSAGTSIVDNISMSDDMEATLRCLTALGIGFQKVLQKDQDAQLWLLMAVVMYEFRKYCRLRRIRFDIEVYDPSGGIVR